MPDEPQMTVVKSEAEWARQAGHAYMAIRAKNGGEDPPSLRAARDVDPEAFSSLIEALNALAPATGRPPDAELISLARLRPAGEVI